MESPRSPPRFHSVPTSLPLSLHVDPTARVSSDQGNSREQSCAGGTAQWRGLRGAAMSHPLPSSRRSQRGRPSGGRPDNTPRRPQGASNPLDLPVGGHFPWDSAANRPCGTPESSVSTPSGRRQTTPESSDDAPMHAASLTKGYGGNPPSGRSVSPPRTGPFFLPRTSPTCRAPQAAASRRPGVPASRGHAANRAAFAIRPQSVVTGRDPSATRPRPSATSRDVSPADLAPQLPTPMGALPPNPRQLPAG